MIIKKSGSHIFGAELTNAERKAMDIEIQKSMAEYDKANWMEIDAMVLWVLRTKFGWGPKRLREFYDGFVPEFEALLERYEMDPSSGIWLCTKQLKDYGVDLEQWEKERK
jgi:hypothetical protein